MSIKHVAVWGGTGNLGPFVVDALINAGFTVDIISRSSTHPPQINKAAKIKQADPSDASALTAAVKGADAFVSVTGNAGFALQPAVFDAALAAGVKWIIPAEFGCNTGLEKTRALPVFGAKVATQEYLKQKAAEGKVSYAFVNNGAFFDWGLSHDFILNLSGPNKVFDGGDVKYSATNLEDIGKAVAGILKNPDEFKNRYVRIHTAVVTQNQLIAAAKKAGADIKTEPAKIQDVYNGSMETLKTGKGDIGGAMIGFILTAVYDQSYEPHYPDDDSKKLGIHIYNDKEVEELVAKVVKSKAK